MNRKEAKALVTDWMAGEISTRELNELKDYLEQHPTFRAEVNKLRSSWEDLEDLEQDDYGVPYMGPALERKLQEASSNPSVRGSEDTSPETTFHSETVPAQTLNAPPSSEGSERSRCDRFPGSRMLTIAAVASLALIACVYGFFVLQFREPGWIARITDTTSGVNVVRGEQQFEVQEDTKIQSGDALQVSENGFATLSYRNEDTSVTVRNDAKFRLRSEQNTKYISLDRGSLQVDLAEQKKRDSLVVSTNNARAEAMGTSFRIGHNQSTRLEVTDGQVRVSSLTSNDARRITKREYARIKRNGEVVSGDVFTGWVEEFTGAPDGTVSDDGRTAWNARSAEGKEGSGFSLSDGALQVNTAKGKGGGLESGGVWTSEEIDISGADEVNVSVDFGGLECNSHESKPSKSANIEFELRAGVDGEEPKKVVGLSGALQTPGIGVNGLSGSTLRLQIVAVNDGAPECFSLDRVSVLPE